MKRPRVLSGEIKDEHGDIESACTVTTSYELKRWFEEHGVNFYDNRLKVSGTDYSYQRKKVKQTELYLHSSSDFSITDEKGEKYSVQEAKDLLESGAVKNYNLAFQRLLRYNFDLAKTKQSYEKEEREERRYAR